MTAAERRLYHVVARAIPVSRRHWPYGSWRRRQAGLGAGGLRTPPVKSTGTAMERMEEISAFALSKAQTSERAPKPRRTVLLTAVVRQLEAQAVDDVRDLFAALTRTTVHAVARKPVCGNHAELYRLPGD